MRVTVRLFAMLRESASCDVVRLDLPDGATAADALAATARAADLGGVLRTMAVGVAVNRVHVEPSTRLRDGDEVTIIPPVSGG